VKRKPSRKPRLKKCPQDGGAIVWDAGFLPGAWTPICDKCGAYYPSKAQAKKASKINRD